MSKEKWNLELSEYIKQGEPEKQEKAKTWETAIGLQDVDGLKPSEYLLDTAKEHIEGNINIDEAKKRINSYYEQSSERNNEDNTEEADKVSVRIAEILSEKAFIFSPTEMLNIHKRLFTGIYKEAGKYREYNFTKKEWILNDDIVTYSSYETIKETIEYDFNQEKNFSYKDLSFDDSISHLSRFISNIWQVHPFCEGNTRTAAVFLIKYLRTFGFNVNETFPLVNASLSLNSPFEYIFPSPRFFKLLPFLTNISIIFFNINIYIKQKRDTKKYPFLSYLKYGDWNGVKG